MERQTLNASWKMRWKDQMLNTKIPCSVYSDLLQYGEIRDPFYGDNESELLPLSREDYIYQVQFEVAPRLKKKKRIFLRFEGIDTLADIYLNGTLLGKTFNMHRIWEFPVKKVLKETDNLLEVQFFSPIRYMEEQVEKYGEIPCNTDTLEGFPYLRKSSCMSGWDWAPKLPDMGIFREAVLIGIDEERITDVHIRQHHEEKLVKLTFDVKTWKSEKGGVPTYSVEVISPDGRVYNEAHSPKELSIKEPMLWAPRGYGEQFLYKVKVTLYHAHRIEDVWERKIGLRTMNMRREKDSWGESFAHEVNGIAIFAMGADYIPEECLLPNRSEEKTRRLLEQCARANFNTLRVWGGAFYPDDWFYDLCDEYGFLVWQDLMFACSTYKLSEEFEDNIGHEIEENVRRIRHHACLGLWCGNNEMEGMLVEGYTKDPKLLGDYTRMYSYIIPKIIRREDPDTFYWPSSPSSGGDFDDPNSENRGDAHYWEVWHGRKPFTAYRKHKFRYASEFGFESLPAMKTIESFTIPEDRNLFSYVMERHQKSADGYAKMMTYVAQYFPYPTSLSDLVYVSQLMQGQAMRYAVEHWRRYRGQCMGAIVWQLNDCWPAASWSSIDYYGRWKALHYFEKRFFAPLLISCCEEGLLTQEPNINTRAAYVEKSIHLHVANETSKEQVVTVRWALRDSASSVIGEEKGEDVSVPALSGVWLSKEMFPEADIRRHHIFYTCIQEDKVISEGSVLFSMPKYYEYKNPKLTVRQEGDKLIVKASAYAAFVEILNENEDLVLSDNYFDMETGEKHLYIISGDTKKLRVRSIYDIM